VVMDVALFDEQADAESVVEETDQVHRFATADSDPRQVDADPGWTISR
jgi:hypothetical protein